ncbi:hypothetical protein MtrunA17_Chr3g0099211 [Medicago truncatula]|uniref:Transmembrane protein n=1 Tax=Medicago truncatula TaxID=3880 RepID=A0A396IT44_MEDTR|nr:hypothetical protein MtrunA17_Chr3g0099211 [Medicago truncatula]
MLLFSYSYSLLNFLFVIICSLFFTRSLVLIWKSIKRKEEMHHVSIRICMKDFYYQV